MTPGLVQPVFLGITFPSVLTWIYIYVGLIVLVMVLQLAFWTYYSDVGDRQFADPETRTKMNLGLSVTPFGSRVGPTVERLAEPQRSRARRVFTVLNICLGVVVAAGAATLAIYFYFVR